MSGAMHITNKVIFVGEPFVSMIKNTDVKQHTTM